MEITINSNPSSPASAQLFDQIRQAFFRGKIHAGSALPSVRQLANDLGLDQESVGMAYRLLERDAVIQTNAFRGPLVHPDENRRKERVLMQEMKRELQDARDMQMDLLPKGSPNIEGVDVSSICIPAQSVGGDYYSYVCLDDYKLGVVLADVSGHGMRSATVAMRFSEMLKYEVEGRDDAREVLAGLDASLKESTPPEMFVTCGIAVLDVSQGPWSFRVRVVLMCTIFAAKRVRSCPLAWRAGHWGCLSTWMGWMTLATRQGRWDPGMLWCSCRMESRRRRTPPANSTVRSG